MTTTTAKGVLLQEYFDRRALSSISLAPFFRLKSVQFGYGFLDTSTDPALVTDVPITATKADITNVYIDRNPTFSYDPASRQIRIRSEIPTGAAGIPVNGANVNVACILDERDQGVAMMVGQLSVVNSARGYILMGTIEISSN